MTTTTLRPLTDRQRAIWQFIRDYHAEHRMGCGYRTLCKQFGLSGTYAAVGHVLAMQRKGWINVTPNLANSIIPTLESLEACDD
jgi:SOS-response transcriptional repressor LexA